MSQSGNRLTKEFAASQKVEASLPGTGEETGWQALVRPLLQAVAHGLEGAAGAAPARERVLVALEAPLRLANVAECGKSLLACGQLDEAERLYRAMAEALPAAPAGHLGLAQTAARRQAHDEALAHWTSAIAVAGDRAHPNWHAARALLLAETGRSDEFESAIAALPERSPARSAVIVALARLAMRRGWWAEALLWWEAAVRGGGKAADPSWAIGKVRTLLALGQLDEAERNLPSVSDESIAVARAEICLARGNWRDASDEIEPDPARAGEPANPDREICRARILFGLGSAEEAEAVLRKSAEVFPSHVGVLQNLLSVLLQAGHPEAALRTLEGASLAADESPALLADWLQAKIALHRIAEARADFARVLDRTKDPAILALLFEFVPRLFDGSPRTAAWLAILGKSDGRNRLLPTLSALRPRLLLALRDYAGFLAAFDDVTDRRLLGVHASPLSSAAAALRSPSFPDRTRPKLFGIGLSKTGTTSLAAALGMLGFSTVDWINSSTAEIMSDDDLYLYDAFTDTPACLDFERNYHMFPNSKFIYTVRDPADWEASFSRHLRRVWSGISSIEDFRRRLGDGLLHYGERFAAIHQALYLDFPNYGEAFRAYDSRVRRFFSDKPKERFLEFNIFAGDAWGKLCAFAGRPAPAELFPWENRAPETAVREQRRMAAVTVALANRRKVRFEIDRGRDGPAYFVLGVRKCGSSFFNELCIHLAKLNSRQFVDVAGTFFFENVPAPQWERDPALCDLLCAGNVYCGFRKMPVALAEHDIFLDGQKMLMVRDPRDALVSEYFSSAYSHPVPARTDADSPVTDVMERLRREALNSDIDAFVMRHAPGMKNAFLGYVDVARSPRTAVVKYEDYIFRKPDLVRLITRHFDWTVTQAEIDEMMGWADLHPAVEDPTAFVRHVTPGDHRLKLRPATIAALDKLLKPAMEAFGYPVE